MPIKPKGSMWFGLLLLMILRCAELNAVAQCPNQNQPQPYFDVPVAASNLGDYSGLQAFKTPTNTATNCETIARVVTQAPAAVVTLKFQITPNGINAAPAVVSLNV